MAIPGLLEAGFKAAAPAAVGAGLLASPEEAEAGILTASLSPVLRDSLTKYLKGEELTKGNRNKVEKYLATVATDQTAYGRRERMRMQPGASPDVEVDITREIITPESMQGEILVPIMGDASIAGGYLDNVEGVPLDRVVPLQGGPNYSLMNAYRTQDPLGWASMLSAAQAKQDQITRAGLLGDVRGVYSRMGDEAMKFNTMVAEAMVRQLPALQLPKKDIARFNKDIRGTVPDFAGVETVEGLAQLKGQLPAAQKNGKAISPSDLRKLVVGRMSLKKEYGDYGFPSYEDTIRAITEPGLRDAIRGDSGFATIQGMPGVSLLENAYHDTYSHGIPGRYAGGLEESIPLEIMFPDMFADTANKVVTKETSARFGQPLNPQERVGAVLMGGGNQAANQKWLDGVMKYLEDKKKLGRAGAIAAATASGNAMAIPPEDLDLQGEKDRRRAGGRKYRRDNRPSKQLQEYAQGQIAPAIAEAAMGAGKGLLGTVDMVTQAMAAPSPEAARVNPEAFQRQMQQYMENQSLPNQQNPNSIFSTQPMRSLLDQQIMEDAAERENVRRFGETIGGLLAPI